jgi:cation-transporting ATPase 13A1
MMCGDGTNDVGALKQAHVGVALLPNGPDPRLLRVRPVIGQPPPAAGAATTATGKGKLSGSAPRKPGAPAKQAPPPVARPKSAAEAFAQMKRQMEELDAQDKPPIVQLGDASIASPFTSRGASILPLLDIIRQGRCTLVTTLQMFKILALNCLIYAYSLSVLYLEGIKYGDTYVKRCVVCHFPV